MFFTIFIIGLTTPTCQESKRVTVAEKKEFLKLLETLPSKGEFFTKEAIDKAAPYTRVLLALTPKDIEKYDIYRFLALSRGLLDRKKYREYGVRHFANIAHPEIKLSWGVILFNEKVSMPEIVHYLRRALKSEEQAKVLSEILGPNFDDFKKQVKKQSLKEEKKKKQKCKDGVNSFLHQN